MVPRENDLRRSARGDTVDEVDQLHLPRLADLIAGLLRNKIVEGELPDGACLPKQDELLREFRVSRPSLREALRILESEGLLVVKRGNIGGAVVRAPSASSAAYTFGLVLQSRHARIADLAEAIRYIEPIAAALCARRKDRRSAVIPRLKAAQAAGERALGDGVLFTQAARQFHGAFVGACGNVTLIAMLETLETMWSLQEQQWEQQTERSGSYPSPKAQIEVLAAHAALLRAIAAGDDEHATHLAKTHLKKTQMYTLRAAGVEVVQAASPPGGAKPVF